MTAIIFDHANPNAEQPDDGSWTVEANEMQPSRSRPWPSAPNGGHALHVEAAPWEVQSETAKEGFQLPQAPFPRAVVQVLFFLIALFGVTLAGALIFAWRTCIIETFFLVIYTIWFLAMYPVRLAMWWFLRGMLGMQPEQLPFSLSFGSELHGLF